MITYMKSVASEIYRLHAVFFYHKSFVDNLWIFLSYISWKNILQQIIGHTKKQKRLVFVVFVICISPKWQTGKNAPQKHSWMENVKLWKLKYSKPTTTNLFYSGWNINKINQLK